jgi:hypothetical protein
MVILCKQAGEKRVARGAAAFISYYMLETLYKDNDVRPTLSRIMITIPYYL